ncbi:hypothetical protein SE17_04330 [Kouleothrix aurantiaca]|uniref:F5/8 type C domain-containing protein n=1 Tax=Kouleothrix aurantiaca TaxID=186479 RepID=A0A0N8PT26_9CHLR|nr:hypothetical protein SE17_04330 [Kouleothrix aurantiaca]
MSTKALDVHLSDGKLGRVDVLEPTDLSLYGATGKAPLGDGTNKLDASWLPDLDGTMAAVIGLPDPQYDSGWVNFTAGNELVLAHGLGTQPVLVFITYRDNYSSTIEKHLAVTNYPVGVWRQRFTTSHILLYTSWSYVAHDDNGNGLTVAPIRVRAWRSGPVSGGAIGNLVVKESDGTPSVANVTEIQVPSTWLTDLGGGKVRLTASGGGGGGSPISVSEQDGGPSIAEVVSLIFPNDSLTDLGGGVVQIDLASAGSGSGSGSGAFVAHASPTPNPDGAITTFTLPTPARPGSMVVGIKSSGETRYRLLDTTDYSENAYGPNAALFVTPTTSPAPYAGYGSTGDPASFTDANSGTGCGWNYYGNVYISFDLTTPKTIGRATTMAMTSGGWSGPQHVRWEYSDDASVWSEAASLVADADGDGHVASYTWATVGAHRYWRLYVIDSWVGGGGYTLAMREITLHEVNDTSGGFSLSSAPLSTDTLMVMYQEPGGSGGSGSAGDGTGGMLTLFSAFY